LAEKCKDGENLKMMQTLAENHLTLRLIRLSRFEAWPNEGRGFSFVLAKGGQGRYVSDSVALNLLPGDVLVLNSADEGKIAGASDELVFWRFSVCSEHLFPLFAIDEICLLQDIIENLKGPRLYPAASSLAQECHRLAESAPPQGRVDHRSQVLRVAAAVLSAEFGSARSKRGGFVRMEDHLMRVFEELSSTDLLTVSVGDMARKLSCSRRHLNRLFHQHFGRSVASLRMEMRLLKALSLLRDPDMKIINVAEQCGFNHLGLFNACFKKRFDKTPTQWRSTALRGENPVSALGEGNGACPLHANGLCPWTPTPGGRSGTARKASSRSIDPAKAKLRETLIENIPEMSAPMTYTSNSGINAQNDS
jgi:AraC-like DNA-binding protein